MANDKDTSKILTVSVEQLDQLVKEAVRKAREEDAAMAASEGETSDDDEGKDIDYDRLGQVIGVAVAEGTAKASRKRQPWALYDPKTPWQPDKSKALKLRRRCFQNGGFLFADKLSNTEISLLNRITHSGRYIDRLVEVVLDQSSSEESLDIRYNNKTHDQTNELRGHFRSLTEMLQMIVADQEEEDKDMAEREGKKTPTQAQRRHFGDTAASREARQSAGIE